MEIKGETGRAEERVKPSFLISMDTESKEDQVQEICDIEVCATSSSPLPDASQIVANEAGKRVGNIFKRSKVREFLKTVCPGLGTDDVLNNDSFVEGMAKPAEEITKYVNALQKYTETKERTRKGTDLHKANEEMQKLLKELKDKMAQASKIQIDTSLGLDTMMASAKQKEQFLTVTVAIASKMLMRMKSLKIMTKIQKRLQQRSGQSTDALRQRIAFEHIQLQCLNINQSWTSAFVAAENDTINTRALNISVDEILRIANQIQAEFCIPTSCIPTENRAAIVTILVQHFPIVHIYGQGKAYLLDVHELLLGKDALNQLLTTCENSEVEKDAPVLEKPASASRALGPKNRPGRKPLWITYPSLIDEATSFIKEHSFAAHSRRRTSTGTGTGVSLRDIQKHLLASVPGLSEGGGISLDAIHHLTTAPRKNSSRARRYKGLIDVRVPGKRNQYREDSKNQHFLFARVAYREELASKFREECQFYSCDDMNKLRMGPSPAVSRYHQINRFFMTDDTPNLGDHDFPNPGYLIVPSGYMSLTTHDSDEIDTEYVAHELNDFSDASGASGAEIETENLQPPAANVGNMTKDKLGREHYERLHAGPARIVLRACKFKQSSGQTHANDILPVLAAQVKDGKSVAFLKVDNGSDWNLQSVVNSFYFGRLWKESGLDILGIVSYAARYSAYNNIEHLWSPMSKKLCSAILPSILEGEEKEPCKQNDLSEAQRKQKEAKVGSYLNSLDKRCWKVKMTVTFLRFD